MGESFTSVRDLRVAVDRFVVAWTADAHPFERTKKVVHQFPFMQRYVDLLKYIPVHTRRVAVSGDEVSR